MNIKKLSVLFAGVFTIFCLSPVFAEMLENEGEYITVQLNLDGDPVTPGKQQATVRLLDKDGNKVTDARVKLYYGRPPSDDTPGVNFKASAKRRGEHYAATIDLSSEGQWNFKVIVSTANGIEENLELTVNVR